MLNLGMTTRRGRRARPAAVGLTAVGLGALLAVGFVAPATAAVGDPAESSSQFLTVSGLDLSAADLAGTYASAPGGPASSTSAFQAAVYGALADSVALLGGGLGQEPLVYDGSVPEGLLAVAQTDIAGYSSSDLLSAVAANGAVDPATGAFTELASGGSTV